MLWLEEEGANPQIGQLPGAQTTELVVAAPVTQCHFALHTGTVRSRCCWTGASSLPSLTATKFTNSFGTIHPPVAHQGKHGSGRGGGEGAELSAPSRGSQSHLGQPGTPCSLTLLQPRNTHFHQNTQNTHRRRIPEEGRTRRRLRRSGVQGELPQSSRLTSPSRCGRACSWVCCPSAGQPCSTRSSHMPCAASAQTPAGTGGGQGLHVGR